MAKVKRRGDVWFSNFNNPDGSLNADGSRKRVVKSMDANRATAQKMSDALEARMIAEMGPRSPEAIAAGKMSIDAFEQAALRRYDTKRARGTRNVVARIFRKLRKAFPITHVGQITPKLLANLRDKWVEDGTVEVHANGSAPGAEREIRQLMTVMRWAEREYNLPMQNWLIAREDRWSEVGEEKLQYTKAEHEKIQAAIQTPLEETVYMLAYHLGLRRSEVRHLFRTDIDFATRLVYVRRKTWKDPVTGEEQFWAPKGTNPKHDMTRSIPLNKELEAFLRRRLASVRGEWVVSESLAPAFEADSLGHIWTDLMQRAGVDGGMHTLRHSYISDLLAGGESIYNVQKFAGHKNIKTTERYAHFIPKVSVAGDTLHRMEPRGPMAMAGVAA